MEIFLLALSGLLIITAIMAVGVIMGRKPIAGSCGGVGAALGEEDYVCDLCGGDEAKCEEIKSSSLASKDTGSSFYKLGS